MALITKLLTITIEKLKGIDYERVVFKIGNRQVNLRESIVIGTIGAASIVGLTSWAYLVFLPTLVPTVTIPVPLPILINEAKKSAVKPALEKATEILVTPIVKETTIKVLEPGAQLLLQKCVKKIARIDTLTSLVKYVDTQSSKKLLACYLRVRRNTEFLTAVELNQSVKLIQLIHQYDQLTN